MNKTILQNKKGHEILSDLWWILVFLIITFLMFWLLFKPLVDDHITEVVKEEQLGLVGQYTLLGLAEQKAYVDSTTKTINPNLVTFSDAVADITLAKKTLSSSDFEEFVKSSSYSQTVDVTFNNQLYWPATDSAIKFEAQTIMLEFEGKMLSETCKMYDNPNRQGGGLACSDVEYYVSKDLPENGRYPAPWLGPPRYYEAGTLHIATPSGPVTVHLLQRWHI